MEDLKQMEIIKSHIQHLKQSFALVTFPEDDFEMIDEDFVKGMLIKTHGITPQKLIAENKGLISESNVLVPRITDLMIQDDVHQTKQREIEGPEN